MAAATDSVEDYVDARQAICDEHLAAQDEATSFRIKLQRRGDLDGAAAAIERANHSHETMVRQLAELPVPPGHEENVRVLAQLDRLGLRLGRRLPDAIRENDLDLQRRLYETYDRPNREWAAARAALGLSLADC